MIFWPFIRQSVFPSQLSKSVFMMKKILDRDSQLSNYAATAPKRKHRDSTNRQRGKATFGDGLRVESSMLMSARIYRL